MKKLIKFAAVLFSAAVLFTACSDDSSESSESSESSSNSSEKTPSSSVPEKTSKDEYKVELFGDDEVTEDVAVEGDKYIITLSDGIWKRTYRDKDDLTRIFEDFNVSGNSFTRENFLRVDVTPEIDSHGITYTYTPYEGTPQSFDEFYLKKNPIEFPEVSVKEKQFKTNSDKTKYKIVRLNGQIVYLQKQ